MKILRACVGISSRERERESNERILRDFAGNCGETENSENCDNFSGNSRSGRMTEKSENSESFLSGNSSQGERLRNDNKQIGETSL